MINRIHRYQSMEAAGAKSWSPLAWYGPSSFGSNAYTEEEDHASDIASFKVEVLCHYCTEGRLL